MITRFLALSAACLLSWRPAFTGANYAEAIYDPATDADLRFKQFQLHLHVPNTLVPRHSAHEDVDIYAIGVRQISWKILYDPNHKLDQTEVFAYGDANDPHSFSFPGPTVEAQVNRKVRIKWINQLTLEDGHFIPHLLPIDQTINWANPPGGFFNRDKPGHDPKPYDGAVPTVVHVHGSMAKQEDNGYAEAWYLPELCANCEGFAKSGTLYEIFRSLSVTEWTEGSSVKDYPNDQHPTMLWYSDNTHGISRLNQLSGMVGLYFLRGDHDSGEVPELKHVTEIPLVVSDITLDPYGQIFYPASRANFEGIDFRFPLSPEPVDMCGIAAESDVHPTWVPEYYGNLIVVNGNAWPVAEVSAECHRLRILNSANSRFFIFEFEVDHDEEPLEFIVIGGDMGYLDGAQVPHGVPQKQILLGPGQSADVLVDFADYGGRRMVLRNKGPDGAFTDHFEPANEYTTGKVMAFDVISKPTQQHSHLRSCPTFVLPAVVPLGDGEEKRHLSTSSRDSFIPLDLQRHQQTQQTQQTHPGPDQELDLHSRPPAATTDCVGSYFVKPVEFNMGLQVGHRPQPLAWSGLITERIKLDAGGAHGQVEQWEIWNFNDQADVIHIEAALIEVVGRRAQNEYSLRSPEPRELGMVHTVRVDVNEVVVIRVLFPLPGVYAWGSAIAEHRDNRAKRPYCVLGEYSGVDGPLSCQIADRLVQPQPSRESQCFIKVHDRKGGFNCVTRDEQGTDVVLSPCQGNANQLWYKENPDKGWGDLIKSFATINGQQSCLSIYNKGINQGEWKSNVVVWECDPSDPAQRWKFTPTLIDEGIIQAYPSGGNPSCLDWETGNGVRQGAAYTYSNVISRDCHMDSAIWAIECGPQCVYGEWGEWSQCSELCGGGYRTRIRQTEYPGLVWCSDTKEEEPCNTFKCELHEQCTIRPVYDPYRQKCLEHSSSQWEARVRPCTGEDKQRFTYDGELIQSMATINGAAVCLTAQPDASVRMWPCNGDATQKWSKYYNTLASVSTGLCLNIGGGVDWELEKQTVGLDGCTGLEQQEWEFDCTTADACVGHCPGVCACKLDLTNSPYCDCPGSGCQNTFCFNGGSQYYDGSTCHCRCPVGFYGPNCQQATECLYTEWTQWTPCSAVVGGGKHSRARSALTYPELCLDITDIADCNVEPILPGPGPGPIGPTGPISLAGPITGPFTGCRLEQPTASGVPLCMGMGTGFGIEAAPCADHSPRWNFDGNSISTPGGRCLDIEGGLQGTNLLNWNCHKSDNQRFSPSGAHLRSLTGRCIRTSPAGPGIVVGDCTDDGLSNWGINCQAPIGPAPTAPGPDDECALEMDGIGRCIATTDGYNVVMGDCDLSKQQAWKYNPEDKSFRSALHPGKCLDIEGGHRGTNAILWECHGRANQQFTWNGPRLMASDGRCMDVAGGVRGDNVLIWECNGGMNQKWTRKCGAQPTGPVVPSRPQPGGCEYGTWGQWSTCTASCGVGLQARGRSGPSHCMEISQTRECHMGPCAPPLPPTCIYDAWQPYSPCSQTCGGGYQYRFRDSQGPSETGPCDQTASIRLCNWEPCPGK